MTDSTTTHYGWSYPTVNADSGTWGSTINASLIAIDAQVFANTPPVTSVAGRTGAVTLSNTDISGLGSAALLTASNNAYGKLASVHDSAAVIGQLPAYEDTNGTLTFSGILVTNVPLISNHGSDYNASAFRTSLGLGSLATQSGTFSGTSSGTNTGDQTITLTGDVTGSGTGSFAATIANTNAKNAGTMAARNVTIQSGGSPSGGSNGDVFLIY